jgi:hypothetical protein
MTELVRVGATARPVEPAVERDHVHELREAAKLSPPEREEADEIAAEYERGRWRLVRLELFADVLDDDGRVQRFDSVHVDGVLFKVPHGADNVHHAREAADQSFDRLQAHLDAEGFDIPTEQLESVPFILELDERLEPPSG